jgi:osmotically-inducible protein OsmY
MPTLFRNRWSALLLAASVALTGCTAQDTECLARIGRKVADRSHGAADSIREQVDGDLKALPLGGPLPKDNVLRERIAARLRWDALLADVRIEVQVIGQEVELKGTVKNDAQRRRAADLAETTAGVQAVNEALKVEEP